MTMRQVEPGLWQGVRIVPYGAQRGTTPGIHSWVQDFETKAIRGEACFRAALALQREGFELNVIVAHPGWGESLFLKEANLLHFEVADAGMSPTQWQASTFPASFRDRITVVHDGIDTAAVAPRSDCSLKLNGNFRHEPCRGYHVFMRALPEILRRRPNARIMIVGCCAIIASDQN